MRSARLRAQLETALGERVSSPFTDIEKRVLECIPSGIASLDEAAGGVPRGAITEICGPPSSGKTSIALSILAMLSAQQEVCALVDGADSFDPESGAAAGIDLGRLLWVRCQDLDQVLRSADLLLQGGGFGIVAMDLSDLPQEAVRRIPLASWFRFQRTIENTPSILLVLGRESAARSAASLVLRTHSKRIAWSGKLFSANDLQVQIVRSRQTTFQNANCGIRISNRQTFQSEPGRPISKSGIRIPNSSPYAPYVPLDSCS